MNSILPLLLLIFGIAILVLVINWCIVDARLRGKSSLLVVIAVVFFFPWGWIAWLIFRPSVGMRKGNYN